MREPPYTAVVRELPATVPFVGPETRERARGRPFRARLGANESVFGPSPAVVAALAEAAGESWRYGDPESFELRADLARAHGVAPENVLVGEGVDALLGYAVRLFVEPGVRVATSLGAYPTFNFHVHGYGGELVTVPYRDDREDLDGLAEVARRDPAVRVVYLANPDNPMGSWWSAAAVARFAAALPERCTLCLDEAYHEFAPAGTSPAFDVDDPRVLRFRTFSKAYGLAGLRVGYLVAEAGVVANFHKIRNHFGVNRLAQVAARAALADRDHLAHVVDRVAGARDRIGKIAAAHDLVALPSATNFVAVDAGGDGAFARRLLEALVERDLFLRMPAVAPLDRCLRIGAGTDADLDLLAAALPEALAAARAAG
ncbi:MAG: pyridoxal phosphate-dependent aminotransferase [Alphaproteobacteria bacterium]|nr:pyridoxal phosphate-dependent aminotransferase [Alphaproteobacteria bacterium]